MLSKIMISLFTLIIATFFAMSEAEAAPAEGWRTMSTVDEMTDKVSHFAFLRPVASRGVPESELSGVMLIVSCSEERTNLLVRWGTYVNPTVSITDHEVVYRLGSQTPVTYPWKVVDTSEATHFPIDAFGLLKQWLASGEKILRIQTIPFMGGTRTLTFDLTGMGPALTNVRRACGW